MYRKPNFSQFIENKIGNHSALSNSLRRSVKLFPFPRLPDRRRNSMLPACGGDRLDSRGIAHTEKRLYPRICQQIMYLIITKKTKDIFIFIIYKQETFTMNVFYVCGVFFTI